MVKKSKEAEETKIDGCICPIPNGCRIKEPINLDNLGDAVKLVCSNGEKCKQLLYVHCECFDIWCQSLLKDYKALGNRARNDARMERYYAVNNDHIWGSNAYGKLSRFCKCPCGGTLKKCLEIDLAKEKPAPPVVAQATAKKPKKPCLPPLVTQKKYKGPGKMCSGPSGASFLRNNVRKMSEPSGVGSSFFETSNTSDEPYIPPGLYAAGDDRKTNGLLRNVDTSINVVEQQHQHQQQQRKQSSNGATTAKTSDREKRLRRSTINTCTSGSINTEDELLDELNELFERVPDDLGRETLEELVNSVLARADVVVLSTISEVGDVWAWLRSKADEEEGDTDDDEEGGREGANGSRVEEGRGEGECSGKKKRNSGAGVGELDGFNEKHDDSDDFLPNEQRQATQASNDDDLWLNSMIEEPSYRHHTTRNPQESSPKVSAADEIRRRSVGFSMAFVYRDSLERVEVLLKKMLNLNKM